ncbi:Organic solvent tolerance protein OstA [Chlamydia serpentis]|uniref:Organic solvent tolerance protein OstA n=1 Tax=Chlamydia serpentis TaxID=1967782 RepID=A0A2R8F9T6_9CHLA|nr:Organic solvent tolerance protein OstA [Chlamydia serpentis]SPN73200.1 Organic solvent tolerance protein OstA [Chlamydia serpentis]
MKHYYILLVFLIFICPSANALTHQEAVKKKNSYLNHFKSVSGIVTIEDGVLNIHNNLRIQANKVYVENVGGQGLKLVAHGNVMVNYRAKTLVCDYLEYYEDTDSCLLTNGRFAMYPWFLGGSMITLTPETIVIRKGYISTSEGPKKDLCLSGDYLEYSSDSLLSIGKTTLRLYRIPILFLPPFSIMPMEIPKPPINFRGGTGGFLGSYLGISYSPIAKRHFSSTFFLDSFFKHGVGMGFNMHCSQKQAPENVFNIKSYYAHRLAIDMAEAHDRYRLHGDFHFTHKHVNFSGEYHLSDSWETIADIFPNNFMLKNTGPTRVDCTWNDNYFEGYLTSSVKVNSFQNANQELPYLTLRQYPISIYKTGIYLENVLECGYLNFAFSDNIAGNNFSSLRFALRPKLQKAISLPIGTLSSTLTSSLIYYSDVPELSPHHTQLSGKLQLDYRFLLHKTYIQRRHIIEPFITFIMESSPLAKNEEHYIFSIQDAFHALNLLKAGIDTSVLSKINTSFPKIHAKLSTTHILNNAQSRATFPKTLCELSLPLGKKNTFLINAEWIWKKHCWDHMNLRWEWIGSDNIAMTLEALHRSKYSLIKCDRENFILDVSRPIDQLLNSPLSDRRNLILGKLFVRPHPCWNYRLSLRYGWHRQNTPNYLEYQMILGTKIFEHWQLYGVYEHREADTRFFFFLKLDKQKNFLPYAKA